MENVLAWAVLPPLALAAYIWFSDRKEREPVSLVLKCFLLGALSALPASFLEIGGETVLDFLIGNETSTEYMFLEYFCVVALAEEACKRYVIARKKMWNNPEFNYEFDGIVYSAASALGFAALENILYMMDDGVLMGRLIPVHAVCGILMGYYLGHAKYYQARSFLFRSTYARTMSLLVPVLIHGFWDFALSQESDEFAYAALIMIVVVTIFAFVRIHKSEKEDAAI